jgi:glyoxylase-like metal-dependent hydrolase (beta-lactamase superfamily II)
MDSYNTTTKPLKIEVVKLNDYLLYFYWGRIPDYPLIDAQLGGGSYALVKGDKAIVYDTMLAPQEGKWVKDYLNGLGVKTFTIVLSHWHPDHIAGNIYYKDGPIISHVLTRDFIIEKKQSIEEGVPGFFPPIPEAVPPNITYKDRMDLWLGDMKIELHNFNIQDPDSTILYIPKDKIALVGDCLESPLPYMVAPENIPTHLEELNRLKAMDVDRYFPDHGHIDVIKKSGYDRKLIYATQHYIAQVFGRVNKDNYLKDTPEDYLSEFLERGDIIWWEPYRKVHEFNLQQTYHWYKLGKVYDSLLSV